jgi:hypothetical protein
MKTVLQDARVVLKTAGCRKTNPGQIVRILAKKIVQNFPRNIVLSLSRGYVRSLAKSNARNPARDNARKFAGNAHLKNYPMTGWDDGQS